LLVLHTIVNTFTSKRFIEPLVKVELENGLNSELLIDPINGDISFIDLLIVKHSLAQFDFTVNPIKLIGRIINFFKIIKKRNPDIIICHMTKGAFVPLISSRLAGVKRRVYYNHGVPYPAYNGILYFSLKLIEFVNCLMATEIVTVNNVLIADLQKLTNKKVTSISPGSVCGISDSFRSLYSSNVKTPRELELIPELDKKRILLYVGRPHLRKGFNLLLDCFKTLEDRDDFLLVIVGCNEQEVDSYLGCRLKNVLALGMVLDIKPLYHISDFILLPSYHEGFPMSILEGISLGCVPIVSDIKELDLMCQSITAFRFELNVNNFRSCVINALTLDERQLISYQEQAHIASAKFTENTVTNNYFSFLYRK
tara:strand:- start:11836 stop:12939 length:1104 start_codon:yes stop_codon:yes gene_type:complete